MRGLVPALVLSLAHSGLCAPSWGQIASPGLGKLVGHVAHKIGAHVYIFGGIRGQSLDAAGTAALIGDVGIASSSLTDVTWGDPGGGPSPRMLHGSTIRNGFLYVFGGRDAGGYTNDLYEYTPSGFSGGAWASVTQSGSITARSEHAVALLEDPSSGQTEQYMAVFGGIGDSGVLGGLELFHFGSGTWTSMAGSTEPSARRGASATSYTNTTTQGPCLILYGGEDAGQAVSSEVWRFCLASGGGGGNWTQLSPLGQASLASRHHSAVVLGGRILVFGGYSGSFPVDYRAALRQYDYRLNRWETPTVDGSAPPGRSQHATVAVEGTGMYSLGGRTRYEALSDVWNATYVPPECSAGQFSPNGTAYCIDCDPGSISAAGAYECTLCSPGSYAEAPGSTSCDLCPRGTYSGATGASSASTCTLCPDGTTTPAQGADEASDCVPCNAGYASTDGDPCVPCQPGTHAPAGTGQCLPCPPGMFSGAIAGSCTPCAAGGYNPFWTQGSCLTCPAGTTSVLNATECTACPAGSFHGSTAAANGSCSTCSAGSYSAYAGAATCSLCPAGTSSAVIGAANETTCAACGVGTVSAAAGASACTPCPAGTYIDAAGGVSCTACPKGRYRAGTGGTAVGDCSSCPSGETTASTGATGSAACAVCPAGTYEEGNLCQPCPPGTTCPDAGGVGESSATHCPSSLAQPLPGQTDCATCDPTTYSFAGFAHCVDCAKNTTCALGTHNAGEDNTTVCSGRGTCLLGWCVCDDGWSGPECGVGACSGCAGVLEFAAPQYSATDGEVVVPLRRRSGTEGSVGVEVRVNTAASNGSVGTHFASCPVDSCTLSLGDGTASLDLTAAYATDHAACVTLVLELLNPTGGAVLGPIATTTLYIEGEQFASRVLDTDTTPASALVSPTSQRVAVSTDGLAVTVGASLPASRSALPLDVVFLVEDTSAAATAVSALRDWLPHAVSLLQNTYGAVRVGLASLRSKPESPFGDGQDYEVETRAVLSPSIQPALDALEALPATGGGSDGRNAQLVALQHVALGGTEATGGELLWSPSARKIVVLTAATGFRSADDCDANAGYPCPGGWNNVPENDGGVVTANTTLTDHPSAAQVAAAMARGGVMPVLFSPQGSAAETEYESLVSTWGFGSHTGVASNWTDWASELTGAMARAESVVAAAVLDDVHGVVEGVSPAQRHTGVADGASVSFTVDLRTNCTDCASTLLVGVPGHGVATVDVETADMHCGDPGRPSTELTRAADDSREFAGWVWNGLMWASATDEDATGDAADYWAAVGGSYLREDVQGPFGEVESALRLDGVSEGTVGAEQATLMEVASSTTLVAHVLVKTSALDASGVNSTAALELDVTFANDTIALPAAAASMPQGTHDWTLVTARVEADSAPVSATLRVVLDNVTGTAWATRAGLIIDSPEVCRCPRGFYMAQVPSLSWESSFLRTTSDGDVVPAKCLLCPAGSKCIAGVQIRCTGTTYSFGGAVTCDECPAGRICINGTLAACANGQWADRSVEPIVCRDCPAGSYCANGILQQCPAGSFSPNSSVQCFHCRPGTVAEAPGLASCTPCAAGNTSNYGRFACRPCPPGHRSAEGDPSCTPCGPGSYSPGGLASCIPCPHGSYAPQPGSERCALCPPNTNTTEAGSTQSADCT